MMSIPDDEPMLVKRTKSMEISSTTASPDKPKPRRGRPPLREEDKAHGRDCEICSDTASGFHYGVWSCEGCKAFFKRSIQGQVNYICPATNNCTIDKQRRKSCQACRLGKCIDLGMCKNGYNRKERRGQKIKESSPRIYGVTPTELPKDGDQARGHFLSQSSVNQRIQGLMSTETAKQENSKHSFVEHLIQIHTKVIETGYNQDDTETHLMEYILNATDRELVNIINWAKQLPGFTSMELTDRIHLLEESWMEVTIFDMIHRSRPYLKQGKLMFAPDIIMDKERSVIVKIEKLFEKLMSLLQHYDSVDVTHEEYLLLRCLILFNAEHTLTSSSTKILELQSEVLDALHSFCDSERATHRVSTLLLLLPHFKYAAIESLSIMFEIKTEDYIPINGVLSERVDVFYKSASVTARKERQRNEVSGPYRARADSGGYSSSDAFSPPPPEYRQAPLLQGDIFQSNQPQDITGSPTPTGPFNTFCDPRTHNNHTFYDATAVSSENRPAHSYVEKLFSNREVIFLDQNMYIPPGIGEEFSTSENQINIARQPNYGQNMETCFSPHSDNVESMDN